jgi:hypothetical protein
MAVTVDSGVQAYDDPASTDLVQSMDDQVAQLDTNTTQFTTILMKVGASTARQYKEEWHEDQFLPKNTALSVSAASADTTFALTTNEGRYAKVGDTALIVQTGEHIRISGVSASAWTATRAIGSVSAATAVSGTSLGGIVILAGSNTTQGGLPTALVTEKAHNYNYMQIVRNAYQFDATAEWVQWHSGNPLAYHRKKIGVEHKRDIENQLWFGARSYTADGGDGAPRATFGGVDHFVTTNVTDIAGAMDKGEFNDFLRSGMEYGNQDRKALFVSPVVAMVLSEFLEDNWTRARPDQSVWGQKVDAVIDPAFTGNSIPVFVKGDWKRYGEGTGRHVGSLGYLIDMSNIELKKAPATQAGPRYCSLYRNRQANDVDYTSEEFLSQITVLVKNEKAHAKLRGVTG